MIIDTIAVRFIFATYIQSQIKGNIQFKTNKQII